MAMAKVECAASFDTDADDDGEREMTDEERRIYTEQVRKSEGFDVDEFGATWEFNVIQPMDINRKSDWIDHDRFSRIAIEEFNRRFKDVKGELEFVKVLKAMFQPAMYARFYITFDAKDLGDEGKIKTYQTVVLMGMQEEISVLSFRLKPPEDGQGNHQKEWFWQGH